MKNELYITILMFSLFFSCNLKSNNTSIEQDKKYIQSNGNTFELEIIEFNKDSIASLSEQLNGKTFDQNYIEKQNEKDGHTFLISNKIKKSNYLIKIKDISETEGVFEVNIQIFKKTVNGNKRFFNPGNFNLTKRKNNSDKESEINVLKDLLISLTYK